MYVGHNFSFKEQASFNFLAAITICNNFGAQKIKSVTVSTVSPSICHEVMGPEGLMLKLKLQYFGHLMRRVDSLVKTLILGKIEGGRKRG